MDAKSFSRGVTIALAAFALLPFPLSAVPTTPLPRAAVILDDADSELGPLRGISGFDAPMIDALQRGMDSRLFASFDWDGVSVRGSFVEFRFDSTTGTITSFAMRRGTESLPLLFSIEVRPFNVTSPPSAKGPLFVAPGGTVTIRAHDDPSGLLEIRSRSERHQVTVHLFETMTTITDLSQSASQPTASLAFTIEGNRGRILLSAGTLEVSGSTIQANMTGDDLLVVKSLSGFSKVLPERIAILDALGEGRLAAELDFVAQTDGAWIENSARFRTNLTTYAVEVSMGHAAFFLSSGDYGGLLVLGFDPTTMPTESGRQIAIRWRGEKIQETGDTLTVFYAPSGAERRPLFARLPLEATVLVVYLPSLSPASLIVESVPAKERGMDWDSQLALLAAVALVSAAAGYMFRRRQK